jgi:hypothetical protein
MTAESASRMDLYWLPLGAGGHSVRWNGRIFEAVAARLQRRQPCDLYHSAHPEDGRLPNRDGDGELSYTAMVKLLGVEAAEFG